MVPMNNILITGCAGFIGSHTVDLFLKDLNYNIVGIDCLTYAGNMSNLKEAQNKENFKFIKIDICETQKLLEIVNKNNINHIINFAAETHVDNSIKSSKSFIHSNIEGVRSILEICKIENIGLFHISTDEVYGSTISNSFVESDRLSPANPYSATKAAAEHLIKAYENTYGIKNIMVRPANNFGPRQHKEKFIPTILRSISKNKKIPIYGTGKNVRDWLYVKDTAKAIKFILENSDYGEVYNISPSNELANIDLVKKIIKKMNKEFISSVEFVSDRLGHDLRYSISSKKLKMISFDSFSNFDASLSDTIEFYISDRK